MSEIIQTCPKCNNKFRWDETDGKHIICPYCHAKLKVTGDVEEVYQETRKIFPKVVKFVFLVFLFALPGMPPAMLLTGLIPALSAYPARLVAFACGIVIYLIFRLIFRKKAAFWIFLLTAAAIYVITMYVNIGPVSSMLRSFWTAY